ncbi:MAG: flagellar assembly protein FliW [Schaedlerella sp.]|uniref:flagellar assembly protein FliW n=1 Tax=Schaedlerella sp. TaxID=2676057 RepID=UPI00216D6757|nr:flagellar assembly protein FliW [uncultured Schaedlerella sp.]MCI9076995.1 flagellar assembly protein FliW [Dorea sp.]
MEINAKYFGQVSYDKNEAIHIINGLIGFEAYTEYLPIPFHEDSDSLISLQSLEDETLSFILMNPFGILADYSPSLSDEELKELDAEASEDLSYYVVCVMRDSVAESTVNLKAPLVVNARTRQARQIILDQSEYTFRHVLGDMMKEES